MIRAMPTSSASSPHAPAVSSPLASPRAVVSVIAPSSPGTARLAAAKTGESPPALLAHEIAEANLHTRYSPRTSSRASPTLAPIAESPHETESSTSDDVLVRPRSNSTRNAMSVSFPLPRPGAPGGDGLLNVSVLAGSLSEPGTDPSPALPRRVPSKGARRATISSDSKPDPASLFAGHSEPPAGDH